MGIPLLLQHALGLVPTLRHLCGLQGHQQRIRRAQQRHCCDFGGGEGGDEEEQVGYKWEFRYMGEIGTVRPRTDWIHRAYFERLAFQAHGVLIHPTYIHNYDSDSAATRIMSILSSPLAAPLLMALPHSTITVTSTSCLIFKVPLFISSPAVSVCK